MTEQDKLRSAIKPYINNVNSLAKKWGIDNSYFHNWYNGMHVGPQTLGKIKKGVNELKK